MRSLLLYIGLSLFILGCDTTTPIVDPGPKPIIEKANDLAIRYIQRLPEIEYVRESTHPTQEGWPEIGQDIVWQAHIKNWANRDYTVAYTWMLDDVPVSSGTIDLGPEAEATLDFPWTWTFERHTLTLNLDPDNQIAEEREHNNVRTIFTDALSVGFYIEEGAYQEVLDHPANTWFEDWAQSAIQTWNGMLAHAIFPETPEGVHDRIRLDQIFIVPNGKIPSAPFPYPDPDEPPMFPFELPDVENRVFDMVWGFPTNGSWNPARALDFGNWGALLHELGHARYLIDVYGFNQFHGIRGDSIGVLEDGVSIVNSQYLPTTPITHFSGDGTSEEGHIVQLTKLQGLMHDEYFRMDRYSAAAMNLIAGQRATVGNYNAPGNIGTFINDLPAENRFRILDSNGTPLIGADVQVFQAEPRNPVFDPNEIDLFYRHKPSLYGKVYDNEADLFFTTDAQGQILVGRNPFNNEGSLHHRTSGSNMVLLLRVAHEGRIGYTFFEAAWLNLAYWRGETEFADYDIKVNLVTPTPPDQ